MILETGQSAWEERIHLIDKAEKRIVLTTFDMREGQSTEDVLSVPTTLICGAVIWIRR